MQQLNAAHNPHLSLVHTIYAIAGVFDLTEVHKTKTANTNNLLQLDDKSVQELSPMFYDFTDWKSPQRIAVLVGEFDSPRFIQQSMEFYQRLNGSRYGNGRCDYKLIESYDHFDIVNDLAKKDFVLTRMIIDDFSG